MKAASISEIKTELKSKSTAQLAELCLRLARFKKENKELLTYLLFEAGDEDAYRRSVAAEIEAGIKAVNTSNLYIAKKMVRKVLRTTNKFIKYSGDKTTEAELLLFFCRQMAEKGIAVGKSPALTNLYTGLIKKIKAAVASLHEDLQYEYKRQVAELEEWQAKY
jgi:hypothetical protein